MKANVLMLEKDSMEVELENITLAEILRVYLNKDSSVGFAAWRRDHPTKKPVLKIKSKNPKKSLEDAVKAISKDLDNLENNFKKSLK